MGLIRWLQERSHVDGEPALDRTRKELLVPACMCVGVLVLLGELINIPRLLELAEKNKQQVVAGVLRHSCTLVSGSVLVSVGTYILCTRRVSRSLCEASVVATVACVIVYDAGLALETLYSVAFLMVGLVDCLLVCHCRASVTKAVVAVTVIWLLARAALDTSDVSGTCGEMCRDSPLLSRSYFVRIMLTFLVGAVIFVVDFHFTRGFANSMREQKALVEASVRVSEAAAVLLSRYETEAARELLEGAEGERLPTLLRDALRQLVGNLALYRPFLPQSCFPDSTDSDETEGDSSEAAADNALPSAADADLKPPKELCSNDDCGTVVSDLASSASFRSRQPSAVLRPAATLVRAERPVQAREAVQRNVSLIAVNTRSFLRRCADADWAASSIRADVGDFTGAVAAGRGVVDLVSGDHLFANFNASRLCTTHRVSATRVASSMARADKDGVSEHTAAVCSGHLLCGDFGTADVRRFMLLGPAFTKLQCLERVAAQVGAVLVDETVGADADVTTNFFTALVERVSWSGSSKVSTKPALVWQLAGKREVCGENQEWLYQLERLRWCAAAQPVRYME